MKKFALFLLALLIPLLAGCAVSGKKPAEKSEALSGSENPMLTDGIYIVDTKASNLYWEAYKPVGGHIGGISMERGELIVQNGRPQSGSFVIDMTSITNIDLQNESQNRSLVNHLKSDDFFGVNDYPTARFDITQVTLYEGSENYHYVVEGDLSLKNVTDSVILYVRIKETGSHLTSYGKAKVDRTKYGIRFRSGSFFENLGDTLIKDEFTLEMELSADRAQKGL